MKELIQEYLQKLLKNDKITDIDYTTHGTDCRISYHKSPTNVIAEHITIDIWDLIELIASKIPK